MVWGLEVNNREKERGLLLCFGRAEVRKKRQRAIGEEGEGYKYPLAPNGHLSRGTTLKSRQCHDLSTAVPLFKCGSVTPRKTARVRVKCSLSWL